MQVSINPNPKAVSMKPIKFDVEREILIDIGMSECNSHENDMHITVKRGGGNSTFALSSSI